MNNKNNNNLIDGVISLFHSSLLKEYFNQETEINVFSTRLIGVDENPSEYVSPLVNPSIESNENYVFVPCEEIRIFSHPPVSKVKVKKL